ncbi:MAG TPA: hypothetical protein VJ953_16635 [Saprospiraceae bacterium]|nr:hypothetical protein [Saprospiraceae bacterium]
MSTENMVSITFFEFDGLKERWWGFRQMGLAAEQLAEVSGLQFSKMLGSGSGNGFSIWPNFGVYGLLGVWDDEAKARYFIAESSFMEAFRQKARSVWTVFMRTAVAHGAWDGQTPFESSTPYDKDQLVAVITRATIRPKKLWQFWRFVPPVSRSMSEHKEGLLFSVGIGELPLIQQATFSLWENSHLMQQFAYKSHQHKRVVKRTRELDWYKEELFARFHPFDTFGDWKGENLLQNFLAKPPRPL